MTSFRAIFVLAGHGLTAEGSFDSGATGNGTTERAQTVALAHALLSQLEPLGLQIFPIGVDANLSVAGKTKAVNDACQAKNLGPNEALLIELHLNSSPDSSSRGVEAWYGMSKPSAFAQAVVQGLAKSTGLILREPSVKPSNQDRLGRLGILDDTIPTSCLLEVGFISNADDVNVIENNRNAVCQGIVQGVSGFLGIAPTVFADVPGDAWYHDAVSFCLQEGLLTIPLDGLFRPGENLNRAEAAALFARLLRKL